jgi:hypothetical protein
MAFVANKKLYLLKSLTGPLYITEAFWLVTSENRKLLILTIRIDSHMLEQSILMQRNNYHVIV